MKTKAFWRQVFFLTRSSLKARYRNTFGGFLWVVINPLAMYGVQSLVFKHILKISVPDYSLFLLSGLLPWIFISMSLRMSVPVFEDRRQILKSFKLNPLVLIYTQVLDNFINFIVPLVFLLFLSFLLGSFPPWQGLVLLPLTLGALLLGILPFCWILSLLQIFFRDIRFIVEFVLSFLFFLTPIFYPREFIPQNWQFLVDFNIVFHLIDPFVRSLYRFDLSSYLISLLVVLGLGLVFGFCGHFLWRRLRNEFFLRL